MKSGTAYSIQANLAIVLVGDPKTGKTRVMMSFPTPYILDLDKNLASAKRIAGDKEFYYNNADEDDDGKPIPVEKRLDWIESCVKRAAADPKIKTICLDSLTRLGELVEEHIIARLKSMGVKLRDDVTTEQIRLADYDSYQTFILRLVALCRSSGKLVVWTSHQVAKDDPNGTTKMRYSIAGKLKETLGGYFTDVFGMKAETKTVMENNKAIQKTFYTLRTRPVSAREFVPLGTSMPNVESEIDISDKGLNEIWKILEPKLSNVPVTKTA